jgi:carboxyl-terminal processing protease
VRSLKRSIVFGLFACAVCGSFLYGRALGSGVGRLHGSHPLSNLLSLNAGLVGNLGSSLQGSGPDAAPSEVFEAVLDHVQHDFVEDKNVADARLSDGALSRMLASLDDPKTAYLEPSLRKARQEGWKGRFHGIGAILTVVKSKKGDVDYRHLAVVDVMPGSPAEKTGLRSGDRITEINGHWIIAYSIAVEYEKIRDESTDSAVKKSEAEAVSGKFKKGYSLSKALPLLIAGENRPVEITVERANQAAPLKFDLTTAFTEVDPVEYRVVGNHVGYLRIRQFNEKATTEMQDALSKLDGGLKGLIVDLRSNPGGVRADPQTGVDGYNSALKLIGWLTHGGTVAMIERRPRQREPLPLKTSGQPIKLPLAVLVDRGTANLSELVTAALRDSAKARVVGVHTFGDNVLQMFVLLKSGGGGVEMSIAHFLTATGGDLSRGIEPDIAVAGDSRDAALERALTALGA